MVGNARARQTRSATEQFALAALRSQSRFGWLSRDRMDRIGMDAWVALFRVRLERPGSRPSRHLADDPDRGIQRRRRRHVLYCVFKFDPGDHRPANMAGNAYPGHETALRSN